MIVLGGIGGVGEILDLGVVVANVLGGWDAISPEGNTTSALPTELGVVGGAN